MSRRPVNAPYTITTEFGVPDSYAKFGKHSGVDYAVPTGRPIYAPRSGMLTNVVSPTGGNMVVISDGPFTHRLMHNSSFSRNNGPVNEGDEVAKCGTTGLSTGPHCHWDINREGTYPTSFAAFIPPADWLAGAYESSYNTLQGYQRKVGVNGVNYRQAASTSGAIIQEFPPNDILDFKGFVIGETVNGNNIWFVGRYTGGYAWSGAFQDSGVHDLPNLTPVPPVTPTPVPPVEPTPPPYSFQKDLDCVTEVIPAGLGSFEYGRFPASPAGIVLHDFGTEGKDTYQSTVNYFQKIDNISAHFVVSGKKITQMVALKDRAYHAGPDGNEFIGVELDPLQDADTVASGKKLVVALQIYFNKPLVLHKHPEFMPTQCGDDFELTTYDPNYAPPAQPSDLEERVTIIEEKLKSIKEIL